MGCCGSRNWSVDEVIQAKINGEWVDAKVISVTGSSRADPPTDVYDVWVGGSYGSRHTVSAADTRGRPAPTE